MHIVVQVEAEATREERRAHRKASKKQAQSEKHSLGPLKARAQRRAAFPLRWLPSRLPAAGSATAAAALPAASAILSNFGPARPAPAARSLHICRRPLQSRWPLSRLDIYAYSLPNPPSISACFPLRSRTVRRRVRPRDHMQCGLRRTDSSPRCRCVCVCLCV